MTQILKNKSDDLPLNDLIVQTILSNIPALARGDVYLAEDLMGSDVWATLSIGMRIDIGGVIRQLVKSRLLPFTDAGKRGDNKRIYRLD